MLGEDFCSIINDCNLPLPPKKYDFGEHEFRYPDHFLEIKILFIRLKDLLQSSEEHGQPYFWIYALFGYAERIDVGCFEANVTYTLK